MGHITNKMAEAKSTPGIQGVYKSPYATINTETGHLILRTEPYKTEYGGSLEDVEYTIIDGALYIQARQIEWFRFTWGYQIKRTIYGPPDNFLEKYEVPEDCIIRDKVKGYSGFFGQNKYPIAIDVTNNPHGFWFKKKKSENYVANTFEYCAHPYKISE